MTNKFLSSSWPSCFLFPPIILVDLHIGVRLASTSNESKVSLVRLSACYQLYFCYIACLWKIIGNWNVSDYCLTNLN
jgi:hypothetical protein